MNNKIIAVDQINFKSDSQQLSRWQEQGGLWVTLEGWV